MKIYKCDGERFSDGVKCTNVQDWEDKDGYPDRWLTINGLIHNNLPDRKLITSGGAKHFCSFACLSLYLLKNVTIREEESE